MDKMKYAVVLVILIFASCASSNYRNFGGGDRFDERNPEYQEAVGTYNLLVKMFKSPTKRVFREMLVQDEKYSSLGKLTESELEERYTDQETNEIFKEVGARLGAKAGKEISSLVLKDHIPSLYLMGKFLLFACLEVQIDCNFPGSVIVEAENFFGRAARAGYPPARDEMLRRGLIVPPVSPPLSAEARAQMKEHQTSTAIRFFERIEGGKD